MTIAGAPDLSEAKNFLRLLDPAATSFTLQTFDDDGKRKDASLARVLDGTLDHRAAALAGLNERDAGVFVTVNETDGRGRKTENVRRVRAVFVDLDGAPLEPCLRAASQPHVVVESSPSRWHCYWLVSNMSLDQFGVIDPVPRNRSAQRLRPCLHQTDPEDRSLQAG